MAGAAPAEDVATRTRAATSAGMANREIKKGVEATRSALREFWERRGKPQLAEDKRSKTAGGKHRRLEMHRLCLCVLAAGGRPQVAQRRWWASVGRTVMRLTRAQHGTSFSSLITRAWRDSLECFVDSPELERVLIKWPGLAQLAYPSMHALAVETSGGAGEAVPKGGCAGKGTKRMRASEPDDEDSGPRIDGPHRSSKILSPGAPAAAAAEKHERALDTRRDGGAECDSGGARQQPEDEILENRGGNEGPPALELPASANADADAADVGALLQQLPFNSPPSRTRAYWSRADDDAGHSMTVSSSVLPLTYRDLQCGAPAGGSDDDVAGWAGYLTVPGFAVSDLTVHIDEELMLVHVRGNPGQGISARVSRAVWDTMGVNGATEAALRHSQESVGNGHSGRRHNAGSMPPQAGRGSLDGIDADRDTASADAAAASAGAQALQGPASAAMYSSWGIASFSRVLKLPPWSQVRSSGVRAKLLAHGLMFLWIPRGGDGRTMTKDTAAREEQQTPRSAALAGRT